MTGATTADVIAKCAADREAATAGREYTVVDAIQEAQWLRTTPEAIVDTKRAKRCIDALLAALERSKCYFNAVQRNQETFVLVQQDRAAPAAIRNWALKARSHGCPDEKVIHAFQTAEQWEGQPDAITKWPD